MRVGCWSCRRRLVPRWLRAGGEAEPGPLLRALPAVRGGDASLNPSRAAGASRPVLPPG